MFAQDERVDHVWNQRHTQFAVRLCLVERVRLSAARLRACGSMQYEGTVSGGRRICLGVGDRALLVEESRVAWEIPWTAVVDVVRGSSQEEVQLMCMVPKSRSAPYRKEVGEKLSAEYQKQSLEWRKWAITLSRTDADSFSAAVWARLGRAFRNQKIDVVINPISGGNHANVVKYQRWVQPILENAGLQPVEHVTTSQGDGERYAETLDLVDSVGILSIGGDGTLYELVNGLCRNPKYVEGICFPIGVLPFGSGNGVAASLQCSESLEWSVLQCVRSCRVQSYQMLCPAWVVRDDLDEKRLSVLGVTWGLVADTDVDSDTCRWLGSARFDVVGLRNLLFKDGRRGRISLVCSDGQSALDEIRGFQNREGPGDLGAGTYSSVMAYTAPFATPQYNFAPFAKLESQEIDVVILRKQNFSCKMLKMFLSGAFERGAHVLDRSVLYFKSRELTIETLDNSPLVLDGELTRANQVRIFFDDSSPAFNMMHCTM
ncbi:Sphingosine kinase 1 [Porphyridium purpureum]|uniref:Sphingosine kinase 1 n=1 Tax=Porphyridium purpureum TaxID=35688 RepID=A0A5J4Z8L5_PORPP|nr:Sphingosine kinase 1 [Porphyridium purpureum]|eukprot:POR9347..scf295_1